MSVRRYDIGALQKAIPTPQGGIRIPAYPTRVGILDYRDKNGNVQRELRPPEEVFSPDSLASMQHAPVTDDHPGVAVDPTNWSAYAKGHVGEDVAPQDNHVGASLLIQDGPTIQKIDQGDLKECSCGYNCDLDMTPGTWNGEKYDAVQRNIRYNHVALGPDGWGRAGSSVALRLDSDACQIEQEGTKMKTQRIDGVDYEIGSTAWVQACEKRDARIAAKEAELEAKLSAETKRADTATGRADAAEASIKTLKADSAKANDPKVIHAAVMKRAQVLTMLSRVKTRNGQKFDAAAPEVEASSTDDMLVQLMKEIDPSVDLSGKSPDYIQGAFLMAVKTLLAANGQTPPETADQGGGDQDPLDAMGQPVGSGAPPNQLQPKADTIFEARRGAKVHDDSQDEFTDSKDPEEAYKKMHRDNANAWRPKSKR